MQIFIEVIFFLFALIVGLCLASDDAQLNKEFMEWFNKVGGKARKLSVENFDGMGNGLYALKNIKEGERVISVPLEWVISRETLLKEPLKYQKVWSKFLENEEEELVALFLMQQLALGSASSWQPYINVLPKSIPLPHLQNDKDLQSLQSPYMINKAKEKREQLRKTYSFLKDRIDELFIDVLPADKSKFNNFETYAWGIAMMSSRALSIQGKKYLVPLSDMFNYAPQADRRKQDDGANFLLFHRIEDGTFKILADRNTAKGEQLFEDYGDSANNIYFNYHGFIAENNPFDCADITIDFKAGVDAPLAKRRALFHSVMGQSLPMSKCFSPTELLPLPSQVLLAVAAMDNSQIERCLEIERRIDQRWSKESVKECIGDDLHYAYSHLHDVVNNAIKVFPTTEKEDEAILSGKTPLKVVLSEFERTAVQYRLSQKKILNKIKIRFEPKDGLKSDEGSVTTLSEIEVQERYTKIIDSLNDWITASNPPINKIKAAYIPGYRLAAVASQPIKKEEVYLSLPMSLCMDVRTAEGCDVLGPVFEELLKQYTRGDDFHALLFHLIFEKFKRESYSKKASFWKPYLDTLPQAKDTHFPVFWSREELDELQGSTIKTNILEYQNKIKKRYEGLSIHVFPKWPLIFTQPEFNFENYLWATAILDSRAIWWGQEGRHLVPLLDLINCNEEGPDKERVHSTVADDTGKNSITKSDRDYHAGDQIFENYGQPNWTYLNYHGFILDANSHDCLRVQLNLRYSNDNDEMERKKKQLQSKRLEDGEFVCLVTSEALPSKFYAFLAVNDNIKVDDKEALAISSLSFFEKLALKYPTSIEADNLALKNVNNSLQPHLAVAIRLRMQEKQHIQDIINKLKFENKNISSSEKEL